MPPDNTDQSDVKLRDYVRVIWRRKWIVVGITVVIVALGAGYTMRKTPMYAASATLIYENQIDVSNPLSTGTYVDPSQREVELDSVATVIASPDIAGTARALIDQGGAAADFSVSAAPNMTAGQTVASTVTIAAVSPDPKTAALAANAYATAFTAYRRSQEQAQVRQAEGVVQGKLDSYPTTQHQSVDYLTLKQRLQDLQILEATVTGNFHILIPATTPSAPFSPHHVKAILMAIAAGIVLGVGMALFLEQFDTRVRSSEGVVAIFDMPVLANVRKLSSKAIGDKPLVVLSDSHSPAAEAIRKLRGNLEFANVDGNLRSFVITSALQHEGKSLTGCNLAISLAATGVRTVLVDGDLRRPQVHRYFDLPNGTGLSTVLTGRSDLSQALRSRAVGLNVTTLWKVGEIELAPNGGDRLHVLTSGPLPPNAAEMIASKSFMTLMEDLRERFELVIVDAPSVLAVGDAAAIARSVDGLVFLVDLTRARRPALNEAARQIAQMPCRKLGLVVIGTAASHRYSHDRYSYCNQGESPLDGSQLKSLRRKEARV